MHRSAIWLLALVAAVVVSGCKSDPAAHNSAVISKETSERAKLQERLKGMSPAEREAEMRNNPKARALLMPGGLGNPANRMGH
ncbi:MAG TPA: hypothetical protein VGL56_19005 [Fimbriimonadaceae bacterium]